MRQLTPLDAQFLSVESDTTAAHVAGVAILDPATAPGGSAEAGGPVTRDRLVALLRERLHLAPPLRMRLADVPLGLDRPYWIDDPLADPDRHVHETVLPAPGDDRQLAAYVARVHARRLDRGRPLWEAHLIRGLSGGRIALYTKVHHCAIDGVSGSELLSSLLDATPEPRRVEVPAPARPDPGPGLFGMLAGALTRTLVQPVETLTSLARTAADLDALPILNVPRTPFNGPITSKRAFSFGSLPMSEVRRVARAFGMSPNDVVMTVCSSALRRWLLARDALPDRPLIAAVPVALRRSGDGLGNRISAMITPMATDVVCPKERLSAVRSAMAAAKRRFALTRGRWLNDVCAMLPMTLSTVATPVVFRLAGLAGAGVNLIVSNVPGPRTPLYLCGARMVSYHPMSVVTDATGGISITCVSYDGRLDFGIVVCPSRVPDVWSMIGYLRESMDELLDLI